MQNAEQGRVASFSSSGLAFDGGVKPDLVAPGVGLATADPGADADGSPRFVTVNGSSAAAATVAGAAALLAQARPALGASALSGLLVGSGQQLQDDPVTQQGAGLVDVGAATAGELAASPSTLALGRSTGAGWRVNASFTVTNLSTRTLHLALGVRTQHQGAAAVDFQLHPTRINLRQGRTVLVRLNAITASAPSGSSTADGSVLVVEQGGGAVRVPWAIAFGGSDVDLIAERDALGEVVRPLGHEARHSSRLDVGRVLEVDGRPEIRPVAGSTSWSQRADGTASGLLARLRDVLPGRIHLRPHRTRP